jgi:hypothetical protein
MFFQQMQRETLAYLPLLISHLLIPRFVGILLARHYITIAVFDIKEVKRGNLKKLNLYNFHPILMHFFAKYSS